MGKVEFHQGDLMSSNVDVICHQVNCLGIMGGGIAAQIKKQHPDCYEKYAAFCRFSHYNEKKLLGKVLVVESQHRKIANIFSQSGDLSDGEQQRHTEPEFLRTALKELAEQSPAGLSFGFPFKYGCGIADGNWDEILEIIVEFAESIKGNVEIWKFQS